MAVHVHLFDKPRQGGHDEGCQQKGQPQRPLQAKGGGGEGRRAGQSWAWDGVVSTCVHLCVDNNNIWQSVLSRCIPIGHGFA